jgi:FkbM family methyltransferase
MHRLAHGLIQSVLRSKGYELRKHLPMADLDAVRLLMAYYFRLPRPPVVVQIGACDGTHSDPIHDFLKTGRVRAVLLEPMPYTFERLRKAYEGVPNLTIIQTAVFHHDTTVTLHGVKRGSPSFQRPDGMLLASFDRQHLIRGGIPEEDLQSYEVPALSLATLWKQEGIEEVDLLQIDTEGFDAEVVKMALQLPSLPAAINFEKKLLSVAQLAEVYRLLVERGYLFLHDDMNTLPVSKGLSERFSASS